MVRKDCKFDFFDISSSTLHLMAMYFMLLDHLWATVVPGNDWLTCFGRLSFPIFAFLIVEGYFHTHSLKMYMLRLLILAIVSEIPFNLIYGGEIFYPYHQNVIWTFLISLGAIFVVNWTKRFSQVLHILLSALAVALSIVLGYLSMADYYGTGVATVLVFYFFHKRKWWCFLAQAVLLGIINLKLIGGVYYSLSIAGHELEILRQGFAMFSLIPIWLYKGRQGFYNNVFKYACYAFYPVHILILALMS